MNTLCKIKNRLTSKTYLTALTLGIVTAIEMSSGYIGSLLPENYRPLLLMVWPVTMMTLRELTNTSLNKKTPNDTN